MQLTVLEQGLPIDRLRHLAGPVVLVAPTGKAAYRLQQQGRPTVVLQAAIPLLKAGTWCHLVVDEASTLTTDDAKTIASLPAIRELTLVGQPAPEVLDLLQGQSPAELQAGDLVRLVSKPDGRASKDYPLTVGQVYEVLGFMGSNIETTCDEPGRTVSYWRGRVEKAGAT